MTEQHLDRPTLNNTTYQPRRWKILQRTGVAFAVTLTIATLTAGMANLTKLTTVKEVPVPQPQETAKNHQMTEQHLDRPTLNNTTYQPRRWKILQRTGVVFAVTLTIATLTAGMANLTKLTAVKEVPVKQSLELTVNQQMTVQHI
jgi:Na+-transporting methylmalonyl-CoA/oxaloacetate decarboxylase gamma subunit